eukprot:SAG11_NODE_1415_length_4977_cov_6.362444_6_plen_21_part_01
MLFYFKFNFLDTPVDLYTVSR